MNMEILSYFDAKMLLLAFLGEYYVILNLILVAWIYQIHIMRVYGEKILNHDNDNCLKRNGNLNLNFIIMREKNIFLRCLEVNDIHSIEKALAWSFDRT